MMRRTMLEGLAGLGAAGLAGATQAGEAVGSAGGRCACGRVDVHAHYLPPAYRRALEDAGLVRLDGGVPVPTWSPEAHLELMQARGITTSMLSISSPGVHFLDRAKAARVSREANEAGAALVEAYPGKFGFFACVPLPDVADAVAEIAHAFDHLGADGVCLETNVRGLYLGDPAFAAMFDELDRRGAVVFLHPTSPECLAQIGMGFPGPLIEFPFDTARAAVSLIYGGVLRRRPNMRVILSHGGGALPGLVSRIAMVAQTPLASPRPEGGAAEVVEEVRRLYFDLALAATPVTLDALLRITDMSHILFGTDFPFAPPAVVEANTAAFVKLMDAFTPEQRAMVNYRNAVSLFPRLKAFLTEGAA
jgi:predicted TIM-barrel fold metal-dependent hydrolase